jgi:hypothetical protein
VLEVTPGVACLLSETTPLPVDAPTSSDHPVGPDRADLRRPDPHAPPLCTVTVADRLAAGALVLAPDRTGVSLWARGLRVGDFRLPSPLREISGRLWLTDAGIAAGHAGILALALEQGRQLVGEAQRTVSLHPPNSPARLALQTFLERIREAVSGGDRLGLAGLFTTPEASEDMPTVAALPANPSRWLQPLLRHALARPIHIETAWLSWKALRVLDAHAAGRVELGLRHDWIKRATREGADPEHVFLAAALSVAFAAAEMGGLLRGLQRIMATARALE